MASASHKAFLKKAKSKKKHEQTLETADDFQAAGVEHEDAAGKWRAGDPVKSMRFFQRAIELYSQGLQRFPRSLDLAYNKARIELEIATHPTLIKQLQIPVLEALRHALISHQYALKLDRDNADTLFNTSQVLTCIGEEIANSDDLPNAEALQYLNEALEMQDRCLNIQELKFKEYLQQQQDVSQGPPLAPDLGDEEDGGVQLETRTAKSEEDHEQWASIVEPVTQDTLIDTILAQLGTLTTLCGLLGSSPDTESSERLAWVEEYASKLLNVKLPSCTKQGDQNTETSSPLAPRSMEIALARANLVSSLLEAGYRASKFDAVTYKRERDQAFAAPEMSLESNFDALLANGRSLITFSVAVLEAAITASWNQGSKPDIEIHAKLSWNALSTGLTSLLTASRLRSSASEASNLATTHMLRGDISLLQYRLSLPPISYQQSIDNAVQLLRNAEVFYRNASKLSPASDLEDKMIATFRSVVSKATAQARQQHLSAIPLSMLQIAAEDVELPGVEWQQKQIEDMIDEGSIDSSLILP